MNTLCPIIICFVITITECCMRTIPPDDSYISSTLPYEETTEMMTTMETSTMTEKVCPEMPAATACMDLTTLGWTLEFGEVDGCPVVQCKGGLIPWVLSRNYLIQPKLYPGIDDLHLILPVPPTTLAGMGGKSFYEYYGLVCGVADGNPAWMMSKYPNGLIDYGRVEPIVGADGSYDGKQAPIREVECK